MQDEGNVSYVMSVFVWIATGEEAEVQKGVFGMTKIDINHWTNLDNKDKYISCELQATLHNSKKQVCI